MANLFWLSDEQWAVIEPFMRRDQPRPEQKDDRQIISGILHVLTSVRALARLPGRVRPAHHGLQPLQSLVAARLLEGEADRAGHG
ncbi:Transposase [Methylobacterium phyllosphaerae]|uniref:Transposase n=1 Tax=Methylobacterium phyllosphaerae TaxID=418223 RepID=A0AAE8L9G7_9HYPH|nr:Transposase [Methylobacterium phyllosphaerae]SFH64410.1 Putative transposase of IS4/5 family [Methylobacterium phyllosphaerae]